MLESIINYFNTHLTEILLGFLLGCVFVWVIWRFFFHFIYQDDNTDKNIESLEKKIDQIANHLGVSNKKEN